MANAKISALPAASTPLTGAELVPVVQSGVTEQVSVTNLTAGRTVSCSALGLGGTPNELAIFNSTSAASYLQITNTGTGTTSSDGLFLGSFNAGAELKNKENAALSFGTNNTTRMTIAAGGDVTADTGNLIFNTAAKGIYGSSPFSVAIANGAAGTILDLSVAMPAGSSGIVNVYGASAGKATILCQRDQGGYYSVTELGTQPRGTYITSISLSGTNLRITNSTGGAETFSGRITLMI